MSVLFTLIPDLIKSVKETVCKHDYVVKRGPECWCNSAVVHADLRTFLVCTKCGHEKMKSSN